MSEKKYKASLRGHSEEWTQAEHDAVKAMTGDRFAQYTVELIQAPRPADVPASKPTRPSATTANADTPAA